MTYRDPLCGEMSQSTLTATVDLVGKTR